VEQHRALQLVGTALGAMPAAPAAAAAAAAAVVVVLPAVHLRRQSLLQVRQQRVGPAVADSLLLLLLLLRIRWLLEDLGAAGVLPRVLLPALHVAGARCCGRHP
jgi:hypothetical protein